MAEQALKLGGKKQSIFLDHVKKLLPDGGNLNLCLTCGACASGCPATGMEGLIPGNSCEWPLWEWMKRSNRQHGSGCAACAPAAFMFAP